MTYPDKAQLFDVVSNRQLANPFDITVGMCGIRMAIRFIFVLVRVHRAVVSRDPLSDSVCMMCLISRVLRSISLLL